MVWFWDRIVIFVADESIFCLLLRQQDFFFSMCLVAAGNAHTLVVTEAGELWACGNGAQVAQHPPQSSLWVNLLLHPPHTQTPTPPSCLVLKTLLGGSVCLNLYVSQLELAHIKRVTKNDCKTIHWGVEATELSTNKNSLQREEVFYCYVRTKHQ